MNRLKELRQEKKLSQKAIADIFDITEKTVSRWENGESQIKPDKAQKLADYFGVSVGYLLGFEDLLDQIEQANSHISEVQTLTKELSSQASSNYDVLLSDILEVLTKLKELAEVKQVDSKILLEVIGVLEEYMTDLDDTIKTLLASQIKFIELQTLKKKLNKYKD